MGTAWESQRLEEVEQRFSALLEAIGVTIEEVDAEPLEAWARPSSPPPPPPPLPQVTRLPVEYHGPRDPSLAGRLDVLRLRLERLAHLVRRRRQR